MKTVVRPLIGLLAMGAALQAAPIYVNYYFDIVASPVPYTLTGQTIPQFDTTLGALLEVDMFLSANANASVTILNSNEPMAPSTTTVNGVGAIIPMQVTGASQTLTLNLTASDLSYTVPNAIFCVTGLDCIPSSTTTAPVPLSGSASSGVSSTFFSLFEGTGTVTFDVYAASASFSVPPTPGIATSGTSGTAGGRFTVRYTYDSGLIPEPATMLLMGGSLAALGLLARRTKRS